MSHPDLSVPPVLVGPAGCTPAPVSYRVLALLLDVILAQIAALLVLTSFVLPQKFPNAAEIVLNQHNAIAQELQTTAQENRFFNMEFQPEFLQLAETIALTSFFVFFTYFVLSEWFWHGATLGKHIFRLRIAQWGTAQPARPLEILSRSIIKVASILWWPLLLVNALCLAFQPDRRAGHDYLARTIVTGDSLPAPLPESDYSDDL